MCVLFHIINSRLSRSRQLGLRGLVPVVRQGVPLRCKACKLGALWSSGLTRYFSYYEEVMPRIEVLKIGLIFIFSLLLLLSLASGDGTQLPLVTRKTTASRGRTREEVGTSEKVGAARKQGGPYKSALIAALIFYCGCHNRGAGAPQQMNSLVYCGALSSTATLLYCCAAVKTSTAAAPQQRSAAIETATAALLFCGAPQQMREPRFCC